MKDQIIGSILVLDTDAAEMTMRPAAELARLRGARPGDGQVPVIARAAPGGWNWNRLHNLREALVELAAGAPIGLVADARVRAMLNRTAVPRDIALFAELAAALSDRRFRARSLSGAHALILAAGSGSRMGPLSDRWPKPLLPVLGTPAIDHIAAHLTRFGIERLHVNTAHLGERIVDHFAAAGPSLCATVTTHPEWLGIGDRRVPRPIGSATTLGRLRDQLAAGRGPVVVVCGDAITDVDLAAMRARHMASGAEATVALRPVPDADVHRYGIAELEPDGTVGAFVEKPAPHETASRLASTGIYMFEPAALARCDAAPGQDIGSDLLPALAAGGRLAGFVSAFTWLDMGNPRDLFAANAAAARGALGLRDRTALQLAPGLWVEPGAQVGPRLRIEGTTYVARGAHVAGGAFLRGTNVIGPGCEVAERTLVQDSLLMPGTRLSPGAIVSGMIAWPDGAIRHLLADGRAVPTPMPLDRVGAVTPAAADEPLPARHRA